MSKFAHMASLILVASAVALPLAFVTTGAQANSTTGAGTYDGPIPAGGWVVIDEEYYGDVEAVLTLRGDGRSDLDLYVYDEYGNEICSSVGLSDRESCSWEPRWTGEFRIEIHNYGARAAYYTLHTN